MGCRLTIISVLVLWLFQSCGEKEQKKNELLWNKSFFQIGSQSSPRAADLNGDGVLDIVMGAGTAEIADTDFGVIALDGQNGELLWQQKTNAQIVGSATFFDITADSIPDVFIGGRKHNLKALNGKNGEIIWEYKYQYEADPILKYARFNFYNSTLVPDQNQDGYPELLTINGGNWDAAPKSTEDRHPGVLMLFNLKDGSIIAADTMPDGKESYMSPICFSQAGSEELTILLGTGGETISGHLYKTSLADLKNKKLSNATILASEQDHGFIAPPSIVDITKDGILDIVAISHACKVLALDGKNHQILWERNFKGMESSNAFAIGNFTGDDVPDFLAVMSEGIWPQYSYAKQVVFDGKDGSLSYQDSIGCFSLASPVVYDLNHDGYDDAILSVNAYDCNIRITKEVLSPPTMENQLTLVNFRKKSVRVIDGTKEFKNIFSTPWIGDLDQDGYLDIVYPQYFNPQELTRFLGMQVKRISTNIRMENNPKWGGYLGSKGNGIFPL